jgi:hypothetical protein
MNILNIIDKVYESKYFTTIIAVATVLLTILFVIVLIMGMVDKRRKLHPRKPKKEEFEKITFEQLQEEDNTIKEDVTFEIPVLTENLENFKKSLEEEMSKDETIAFQEQAPDNETPQKIEKSVKIFDINEIEKNELVIPLLKEEEAKQTEKPNKKEDKKAEPKKEKVIKEKESKEEIIETVSTYNMEDDF